MLELKEFQEKLKQLLEKAAAQEKNLSNEDVLQVFGMNQLSAQQLHSLYEYLQIEGICIEGANLRKMDIGGEFEAETDGEKKNGSDKNDSAAEKEEYVLTWEDQECLQEYEEYRKSLPKEKDGEREALLCELAAGNTAVRERLTQLYLSEIMAAAKEFYREGLFIGDLIQEGNITLLTADFEKMAKEQTDGWMRKQIRSGIRAWVEEQTEQKMHDQYLVEKVRKLEAAIRELSDEEDQKFSVEELSAYLDMEEEEIRAVLSLTSEGTEEEKE